MAGSVLPWAVVRYPPRFLGTQLSQRGELMHRVLGTDLTDGRITVGIAIAVVLLGIAGLLLLRVPSWMWIGGLAGAVALVAYGIVELLGVADATGDIYDPFRASPAGNEQVRQLLHVSTSYGVLLVLTGGSLSVFGAVIALVRGRSRSI